MDSSSLSDVALARQSRSNREELVDALEEIGWLAGRKAADRERALLHGHLMQTART
jgi:hypothetical protein